MARGKFQAEEVDQNFQIEDGIRQTLRTDQTAEVSASVIENAYDLLDDDCNPIRSTLPDKCQAIADIVGANFSLTGEMVHFRTGQRA